MALSKKQTKRLGGILSIMFGEKLPVDMLIDLEEDGYIFFKDKKAFLTDKGTDEKNRLCTLAGLNIKYQSEAKSKSDSDKSK